MALRRFGRTVGHFCAFLAVALSGCLLWSSVALAKIEAPNHFSAGDQYVETLPSAKGPKAATGKRGRSVELPRHFERTLVRRGGPDSGKLIQITTSPELGSPARDHGSDKRSRSSKRNGPSQPAVPQAAIDAVGSGQAELGWLVLALLVITALALGAVGYQRYRDKGASGQS